MNVTNRGGSLTFALLSLYPKAKPSPLTILCADYHQINAAQRISVHFADVFPITLHQRFSISEWPLQGGVGEFKGAWKERREAKILHELKATGACGCAKNNAKLVIIVWPA